MLFNNHSNNNDPKTTMFSQLLLAQLAGRRGGGEQPMYQEPRGLLNSVNAYQLWAQVNNNPSASIINAEAATSFQRNGAAASSLQLNRLLQDPMLQHLATEWSCAEQALSAQRFRQDPQVGRSTHHSPQQDFLLSQQLLSLLNAAPGRARTFTTSRAMNSVHFSNTARPTSGHVTPDQKAEPEAPKSKAKPKKKQLQQKPKTVIKAGFPKKATSHSVPCRCRGMPDNHNAKVSLLLARSLVFFHFYETCSN
jgi:hypothetical protein